ncbi:hypothetical protein ACJX0J_026609, partial [Zea mays]
PCLGAKRMEENKREILDFYDLQWRSQSMDSNNHEIEEDTEMDAWAKSRVEVHIIVRSTILMILSSEAVASFNNKLRKMQ